MSVSKKPMVLVILDGYGYREDSQDNAIFAAKTPVMDALWAKRPHTLIDASGLEVGLPDRQMGNSEVGHVNLGAGRIVYQDLTRLDVEIKERTFFSNPVLSGAVASFDCRITQIVSVGTHDTLFCEVVGLVRNDDTHGLAWFDRGYHPLMRQDAC